MAHISHILLLSLRCVYCFWKEVDSMYFRKESKVVLNLNHDELILLRKVLLYTRNKLISEGKPIEDINELILKLY